MLQEHSRLHILHGKLSSSAFECFTFVFWPKMTGEQQLRRCSTYLDLKDQKLCIKKVARDFTLFFQEERYSEAQDFRDGSVYDGDSDYGRLRSEASQDYSAFHEDHARSVKVHSALFHITSKDLALFLFLF